MKLSEISETSEKKRKRRNFILGIHFMTSLSYKALNNRTINVSVRMILKVANAV
jgi:hypothetical protein